MNNKIDVFIIDDDPNKMQYFQSIIRKAKEIRCIGSTSNGATAVDIVVTTHPDVVLIDYALYPVSGFEILSQLSFELPDVPIILLGGRIDLTEQAKSKGAAAYLQMPITPRKLIDTIMTVYTQAKT